MGRVRPGQQHGRIVRIDRDLTLQTLSHVPDRGKGVAYMTLTEGAPGEGLWFSDDNGQRWQPVTDLPFANIQRVEFDRANHNEIYVATFGGGIWRGPAR